MILGARARRGLLLGGSLVIGCGPSSGGTPPGETESSGQLDSTTSASDGSTSNGTSPVDGSGSGSGDSSSTGGPSLPCTWLEGQYDAEIPAGAAPSNVTCDLDTDIATIQLTFDEGFACGDSLTGDSLRIELPPGMQAAGEYDLTQRVANIRVSADLETISGQVDTGTLIITDVTPAAVVGWAHGGLDGYDFVSSFEAPYCP